MGEYQRYERKMNPMMGRESAIDESLLFGEIDVRGLGEEARRKLDEYDRRLERAFGQREGRELSPEQSELIRDGYKLTEEVLGPALAASRGPVTASIGDKVRRMAVGGRMELTPEETKNIEAYSLINTPLEKRLGFTGVVKFVYKGRPIYVPFEHLQRGRQWERIASASIEQLPDADADRDKFNQAVADAGEVIYKSLEREKYKADRNMGKSRHRRAF